MREEMLKHGISLFGSTHYCRHDQVLTFLLLGLLFLLAIGMITLIFCPDPLITGMVVGILFILPFIGSAANKMNVAEYWEYEVYTHDDCDWNYLYDHFDVLEYTGHIYRLRDKGITDTRGFIRQVGD